MATLFMNGMEAATRQLWHNNAHFSKVRVIDAAGFPAPLSDDNTHARTHAQISLVAFSSFFYLLMMITLGIAVPGGLLIPCFFIGTHTRTHRRTRSASWHTLSHVSPGLCRRRLWAILRASAQRKPAVGRWH
jgi:hypothetical protein